MPDGQTGGLQGVQNELTSTTPNQPPPPGAPPVPLPGQTVSVTQPPDYKALGAQQAQADFAAASAGGGWKFEPEAMTKVISELDATIDGDLRHATVLAANLVQIRQPGSDVGSVGYVNVAKTSGASYQQFLQSAVDFVKAYRDKLKEVSDAYQRHDEAALEALRGTGKVD